MKYTYKLTIINGKRVFSPCHRKKKPSVVCTDLSMCPSKEKKKKRKKRKHPRPYVITDSGSHMFFSK